MATVWRAEVLAEPGRYVAIKRLLPSKLGDVSFLKMFVEEARVGAQIKHPNVVETLEFSQDDEGHPFLVMQWVDGLDLSRWTQSYTRQGLRTPWPMIVAIVVEALRGLSAAHDRVDSEGRPFPIFHRDVSASNILLREDGGVLLSDFGLARAMDRASMTRPNVVKGKVSFCAPELLAGEKPGAASDVFSAGVVLWEALAQRRLFPGRSDIEILMAVARCDIPSLFDVRDDLPPDLDVVVRKALSKFRRDRFPTAHALAFALASALRYQPAPITLADRAANFRQARERLRLPRADALFRKVVREVPSPQDPAPRASGFSEPVIVAFSMAEGREPAGSDPNGP